MAAVAAPLPHHNRRPKTRTFGIYIGQVDEVPAATSLREFRGSGLFIPRDHAATDAVRVLFSFQLASSHLT